MALRVGWSVDDCDTNAIPARLNNPFGEFIRISQAYTGVNLFLHPATHDK